MTNFVNFMTDKIRPEIITAYINGPGSDEDFYGSDSSTIDFTKFGYTAAVYRKMMKKGTATDAVKDIVKYIANINGDKGLNYTLESDSGYSILEMLSFDARADRDFKFSDIGIAINDDNFTTFINERVVKQSGMATATPLHMMIEYKQDKAISEFDAEVFDARTGEDAPTYLWAPMYALKRFIESNEDEDRGKVLSAILSKLDSGDYVKAFGRNNGSSSDTILTNEISKFIIASSNDVIEKSLPKLTSMIEGDSPGAAPVVSAIEKADGISKNSISFNIQQYDGNINMEKDKGYTPLFYYVTKFKSSCKISVLNELVKKFSPYTISVVDGSTEGYNSISVIAESLSLDKNGNWNNPELAAWLKDELTSSLGSLDSYHIFVAAGNVRDFTGGSSINSYGVVTNILRQINAYHRDQKVAYADDENFQFDPTSLLSTVLPSAIDSTFYNEWMVEFGQEVD